MLMNKSSAACFPRWVVFASKKTKGHSYLWSALSENEMNGSADDVVAPGIVVSPVRSLRQIHNTLLDTSPLGILPIAQHLRRAANSLDHLVPIYWVARWEAVNELNPVAEAWDPRVVLDDGALIVESPKRDLRRTWLLWTKMGRTPCMQRTCFRGASGLPLSGDVGSTTLG